MVSILGPDGRPIQVSDIREPQTSRSSVLHREFQGHPSRGLTPSRLAGLLEAAEQGDLIAQYELFEDMEEKDGHILAEMGKRRRAITGLAWDIVPPPNASAAEKQTAKWLREVIGEIDDLEDALFDLTDAIGKGFAALEYEWQRLDATWLPKSITHRPQAWFRLHRGFRQELRLRDHTADGEPLQPFGWTVHTHKCKSGYLERSGLYRVLVWPYLFKHYSVADLAEWLEIYGIPLRLGKYPPGSTEKEKTALLRALVTIGHNAAGIMPAGMEIDFKDAATGDAQPFEVMIDWCERTQSKVILGATLTSQADRGSNTHALGSVHNEVRKDLRDSDAKQLAATLTRDLLYPICALNGRVDSIRRAPRWLFDTAESEDIKAYADALPKLVAIGMRIPRQWAQEQVGIPEPEGAEEVLAVRDRGAAGSTPAVAANRAQALRVMQADDRDYVDALVDALAERAGTVTDGWLEALRAIVESATTYDELLGRLAELLSTLPLEELGAILDQAIAASGMAGRYDVTLEAGRA